MNGKKLRGHTVFFENKPRIVATSSVAGPKECAGIIGEYVDVALNDDMYGESTFEKAECKMLSNVINGVIQNAGFGRDEIDVLFSGDLLNQIISASFAARDFDIPFLGLYSACSTMSEAMLLSSALVNAGYCRRAVAATGSHFPPAAVAVDGYGRGRVLDCRRGRRHKDSKRHDGQGGRLRRNRRKQYGRGNGARLRGYAYKALPRYGNFTRRLRPHFIGRPRRARLAHFKGLDLGERV